MKSEDVVINYYPCLLRWFRSLFQITVAVFDETFVRCHTAMSSCHPPLSDKTLITIPFHNRTVETISMKLHIVVIQSCEKVFSKYETIFCRREKKWALLQTYLGFWKLNGFDLKIVIHLLKKLKLKNKSAQFIFPPCCRELVRLVIV